MLLRSSCGMSVLPRFALERICWQDPPKYMRPVKLVTANISQLAKCCLEMDITDEPTYGIRLAGVAVRWHPAQRETLGLFIAKVGVK